MNVVIGVDLAQTTDYTAIAVLEERQPHRYDVRYLERFKNRSYPSIVTRIGHLVGRLPPWPLIAVDATGLGRPVVDMLLEARLPAYIHPISLTGGDAVAHDSSGWRVPKRDVVSVVAVLLETGRLRIAHALRESGTLHRELLSFRVTISASGHDSYEAWRKGDHDDLVLSVALAAWLFEQGRHTWLSGAEGQSLRRRDLTGP